MTAHGSTIPCVLTAMIMILSLVGMYGCQGAGGYCQDSDYFVEVAFNLRAKDASNGMPIPGACVCGRAEWLINAGCAQDTIIGHTNSDGVLTSTVTTVNGVFDAVLVKEGYSPRQIHEIAEICDGDYLELGDIYLTANVSDAARKSHSKSR